MLIAVDVFHGPKRQVQLVKTVQQPGQFCLIPHLADQLCDRSVMAFQAALADAQSTQSLRKAFIQKAQNPNAVASRAVECVCFPSSWL